MSLPNYLRRKLRGKTTLVVAIILVMTWVAAIYELNLSKQELVGKTELRTAKDAHVAPEYSLSTIKRLDSLILSARKEWQGG